MSERNRAPIGIGIPMKHCKYWDKHGSAMIHHLPTGAGFLPHVPEKRERPPVKSPRPAVRQSDAWRLPSVRLV